MPGQHDTFILAGNGPCLNRGCEAILHGTIEVLDRAFSKPRYISAPLIIGSETDPQYFSHERVAIRPDIVRSRFSSAWLARQWRVRVLRTRGFAFEPYLKRARAVLAIGGDNFSLDYNLPTRQFAVGDTAREAGKPFVLWGASVGPFDRNPEFEKHAIEQLKRAALICIREPETQDYLASRGVADNVRKVADPAFVMAPREPDDVPSQLAALLRDGPVGVNLSTLAGGFSGRTAEWLDVATACVRALRKALDRPIVLVPHVIVPEADDHAFLSKIGGDDIPVLPRNWGARELKWAIAQCSVFAGARMHATIAAFSQGVPVLSLGYSAKARGLNRDLFNHLDWLLPVDQLTPDTLVDRMRTLLKQETAVREQLATRLPAYREEAYGAGPLLRELLQLPAAS